MLVQANYGARELLRIDGVPVGAAIPRDEVPSPWDQVDALNARAGAEGGSIIGIVATDAPLLPHQCARLAQRVGMGVARMGCYASHGSGDLFCAFATGNRGLSHHAGEDDPRLTVELRMVVDEQINPLFEAVAEATEEAITNALLAAETMTGRDGITAHALDPDRLEGSCGPTGALSRWTSGPPIITQRAVRAFDPRPIPDDLLERILDAGRRAPSSKNTQPWEFVVVTDRERLRELSRVGRYAGHLAEATVAIFFVTEDPREPRGAGEDPLRRRPRHAVDDAGRRRARHRLRARRGLRPGRWPRGILGLPAGRRCDFGISLGYPARAGLLDAPRRKVPRRPLTDHRRIARRGDA